MKLSNVIAFTEHMQKLISESDIFTRCYFIADDDAKCLKVFVNYRESYANVGVVLYGDILEDVAYEEFNRADFDSMKLSVALLVKLNSSYRETIYKNVPKKMSKSDLMRRYAEITAARREKMDMNKE